MRRITTPQSTSISFDIAGAGPPILLVHGSFSDHRSNWERVVPLLAKHFTVYAIARRGRGMTSRTTGHSLDDESADVSAIIHSIEEQVFLLGHSYGARVALGAAAMVPDRVRRLVLYEAPDATSIPANFLERLRTLADADRWDNLAATFFREGLGVPREELAGLRESPLWPPIVQDAPATIQDLLALATTPFHAADFANLSVPVLLQIGTASPRETFLTDSLAAALPDARIGALEGEAHEAMTTAPEDYARAVTDFLLS